MPYNGESELGTAAVDDVITAGHINDIRARLGGAIPPVAGGYTTGRFNTALEPTGNEYGPTANFIIVVPIWLAEAIDITAVCITLTTTEAGKNARVGLYDADSSGVPSDLIEDAGAFTVASGVDKEESLAASRSVGPGLIYGALITDSATAAFSVSTFDSSLPMALFKHTGAGQKGWFPVFYGFAAQAYGALPDPCPALSLNDKAGYPIRIVLKQG